VEGTRWRLVTVLAGAGYGKTTLIAQALGHVEPKLVWASCDERLGGSADLLAHMAAGIEQSVPGFGAQLAVEGTVERQVMALCNEIVATPADEHSTQQRRTG
jgi:ATP/maltotriose-dependent transcriptional regulator MalT